MSVAVKLVAASQIDRASFYVIDKGLTGENHIGIVDAKRFLSTLAEDTAIVGGFANDQSLPYAVLYASFIVAGPRYDVDRVVEQCRGMPHVCTEECHPDARALFITGSLDAWRLAVIEGCHSRHLPTVRGAFNEIYRQLSQAGLRDLFQGYNTVEQVDKTFLLR